MITSIKVIRMGDTIGVILPKEIVAKLKVIAGDKLNVTETPIGVNLSRYDKRQEKVMEIAERVMQKDREVLKKLAESPVGKRTRGPGGGKDRAVG